MNTTYATALGKTVQLKEKPSVYFKRPCRISGDPDEKAFGHIVDFVGADKVFWASDFPHFDHPGNYMEELRELVEPMSASTRQKVIGDNVKQVYGL
jgi:predicted TIM-barrel fold metal-dependent hydrolase